MGLFTTKEVSDLSGLPVPSIQKWIEADFLRPAERAPVGRGPGGRGVTHRFTPQQAVGLVIVGVLCRSDRGCYVEYARRVIGMLEAFTDDELRGWLTDKSSDWQDAKVEERMATWLTPPGGHESGCRRGQDDDPDGTGDEMMARLDAATPAVLERLGPPGPGAGREEVLANLAAKGKRSRGSGPRGPKSKESKSRKA